MNIVSIENAPKFSALKMIIFNVCVCVCSTRLLPREGSLLF